MSGQRPHMDVAGFDEYDLWQKFVLSDVIQWKYKYILFLFSSFNLFHL